MTNYFIICLNKSDVNGEYTYEVLIVDQPFTTNQLMGCEISCIHSKSV